MKDGTRSKLRVRLAAAGAWLQAGLLLEMLFTVLFLCLGVFPAMGAFCYLILAPLQLLAGLGHLVWITWLGMVLWRPRSQVGT
jgi:hypothetical protein